MTLGVDRYSNSFIDGTGPGRSRSLNPVTRGDPLRHLYGRPHRATLYSLLNAPALHRDFSISPKIIEQRYDGPDRATYILLILQCTCTNDCTARCCCYNYASGCSSACRCTASSTCKNYLKRIPALFHTESDPKRPLSATACFKQYLSESWPPSCPRQSVWTR